MSEQLEQLVKHLEDIKVKYGEEAYRQAATSVARQFVAQGGSAADFARKAFAGIVDFEALAQEAPAQAERNPITDLLQQQIPSIKSQAQFNSFMAAFDALRFTLDAIYSQDTEREAQGRSALDKAYEAARQATDLTLKLQEYPEAANSKMAAEFKQPPTQFTELAEQRALLAEVTDISSLEALTSWYGSTKERRDLVVSDTLRNALFDAIRIKKASFSS